MEKRLLIAFAVSAVILAVYSAVFAPAPPAEVPRDGGREVVATATPAAGPTPAVADVAAPEESPEVELESGPAAAAVSGDREQTVALSNDVVDLVVTNRGGAISSFVLKNHTGDDGEPLELVQQIPSPERALPLQLVAPEGGVDDRLYAVERIPRGVVLRWSDGKGDEVVKRLELPPEGYGVALEVVRRGTLERWPVAVGTGLRNLGPEERNSRLAVWGEVVVLADGKVERYKRRKVKAPVDLEPGSVGFVGFEDAYFICLLRPEDALAGVRITPIEFEEASREAGAEPEEVTALRASVLPRGGDLRGVLLGAPKEYRLLKKIGGGVEQTLDFGMFGPISVLFLKALWWIYGWVGNYGLAIILLTVGIRIVLFPLMHTSTVSMRKMQKIQPVVKEIQARYKKKKSDPTARAKMNQEVMELYKQEGVNPMAGCLPMLVQLPILWALYKLFLHAIELRHAPFILWITDLSAKDPYYVTPILMTATMWLQQRLAPQAGDPQQQKLMRMMPLIFGIMFLQFPSGLVLYWLTNNVLTIIQQEVTFHIIGERRRRGGKGGKA